MELRQDRLTTAILKLDPSHPGDPALSRPERLSAAIRELMWAGEPVAYASPVESPEADDLATVTAEEFFELKPAHGDDGSMLTVEVRAR